MFWKPNNNAVLIAGKGGNFIFADAGNYFKAK